MSASQTPAVGPLPPATQDPPATRDLPATQNPKRAPNTLRARIAQSLQRLSFLQGNLAQFLLWPVVCLILCALLWAAVVSKLDADKAALENRALSQASTLSHAYAENLTHAIQQVDQVTVLVKYQWEQSHGRMKLEELARQGLFPASELLFVLIADRNGTVLTATRPLNVHSSVKDRVYFPFHQHSDSQSLRIGPPTVGRFSRRTVLHFTRRLNAADGSFDGVVVVSVDPNYFTSFYEGSGLGKSGLVAMMGADRILRAARIGDTVVQEASAQLERALVFNSAEGSAFVAGEGSFDDRQSRFTAWTTLKSYPFVAVVGVSQEAILAAYVQTRVDYLRGAVLGSLGLLCFGFLATLLSVRLAWGKHQEQQVRDAYRMATEGGSEGFYMLRPLRDKQGVVVDLQVADCNERGAAFMGSTRADLLGRTFSALFPPPYFDDVMHTFRDALETGRYEDDLRIPPESPVKVAWVHRRIVRSGTGLALTLRDISQAKAHEHELSRLANEDPVTALPNRNWLMSVLPLALERARASRGMLALLFVDLDDFKNVNDTLGHAAGDEVLSAVAARLQSVLRPGDSVVRLGGDEFTVILEPIAHDADAARVAERIGETMREPFELSRGTISLGASIGISLFPRDGDDAEALLKNSDIAMYRAKAEGKGHHRFFEPGLFESLKARLDTERALVQALEEDQFLLVYQPRVNALTGELHGMEALVRWHHPERGLVPPGEFIPLAEETGLIVRLGALVVEKACAQVAQWKAQQMPLVPVSINVSSRQFSEGSIADVIADCLARHGVAADLLEVEITESSMMGEHAEVLASLAGIRRLGVKLLVDDFGTGYSSLSQLQRLDMDGLKIDRSFTAELCRTTEGDVFVRAIVSMAHALGMSVVAEGVETTAQLRVLQSLSCNEVQGYLISRPVPAAEAVALIHKRFLLPLGVGEPLPVAGQPVTAA